MHRHGTRSPRRVVKLTTDQKALVILVLVAIIVMLVVGYCGLVTPLADEW